MRYLLLLRAAADAERLPREHYTAQLVRAGVLLAEDELAPEGAALVSFDGDSCSVSPEAMTDEDDRVAGFWLIQAAGWDEAVEWARRVPCTRGSVEVRRVAEPGDDGERE